jgi:hypothetical protein
MAPVKLYFIDNGAAGGVVQLKVGPFLMTQVCRTSNGYANALRRF